LNIYVRHQTVSGGQLTAFSPFLFFIFFFAHFFVLFLAFYLSHSASRISCVKYVQTCTRLWKKKIGNDVKKNDASSVMKETQARLQSLLTCSISG